MMCCLWPATDNLIICELRTKLSLLLWWAAFSCSTSDSSKQNRLKQNTEHSKFSPPSLFPIGIFIFGSSQLHCTAIQCPAPHYRLIIYSVNESSTFLYDQSVSIDPTAARSQAPCTLSLSPRRIQSDTVCVCASDRIVWYCWWSEYENMIFVFLPLVSVQLTVPMQTAQTNLYIRLMRTNEHNTHCIHTRALPPSAEPRA